MRKSVHLAAKVDAFTLFQGVNAEGKNLEMPQHRLNQTGTLSVTMLTIIIFIAHALPQVSLPPGVYLG